MNEIWTLQKVLNWTIGHFEQKQVPEPRLSAEILLAYTLKLKRLDLYLQFERILDKAELERFRGHVQRRARMEPVQYITGEQEFMGFCFRVNPAVLIPRPETELLVEEVLKDARELPGNQNILDVGTGSGAIAVSLAKLLPGIRVTGIDCSPEAIATARENANRLGAEAEFRVEDALQANPAPGEAYDLVVSNPPYVAATVFRELHPQVREHEPRAALLAGEDGLDFYRRFIPRLPLWLKSGGRVYLEMGYDQSGQLTGLLQNRQFENISVIKDYQHINRIIKAQL